MRKKLLSVFLMIMCAYHIVSAEIVDYTKGGCEFITEFGAKGQYTISIAPHPEAANTVSYSELVSDPVNSSATACRISFNNTEHPIEFTVNPYMLTQKSKDNCYIAFDLYKAENVSNSIKLIFRYDDDFEVLNVLEINSYLTQTVGWQKVTIPLSIFTNTEFNWNISSFILGLGFSQPTTAEIYIRNMYMGSGFNEINDYYYKDDPSNVVLIKDGSFVSPNTYSALNSNAPAVTLNQVADGKNSVKIIYNGTGAPVVFGRTNEYAYADVTSTANYALVMKLKLEIEDSYAFALAGTNAGFWDWGTNTIGYMGSHIKPTSEWQTVVIPLKDVGEADLSALYGVGLEIRNSTKLPTIYLNEFALVPLDTVIYNKLTMERTMNEELKLFKSGVKGVDCAEIGVWPVGASNTAIYYNINNSPQYGCNTMVISMCGQHGAYFGMGNHGITNHNYDNKFLRFDVKFDNVEKVGLWVGRTDGTTTDAFYIKGQTTTDWQTVIVPLSKFTTNNNLDWGNVTKIYIEFQNQNVWYKMNCLDSVTIGSYINGKVTTGNMELDIQDGYVTVAANVSNTMNTAYEFVLNEMAVLTVKDGGLLIDTKVVPISGEVEAGTNAMVLSEPYEIPALSPGYGVIKIYRWYKSIHL